MAATQQVREYDRMIGAGIIFLFAAGLLFGYALSNWAIVETWIRVAVIALVILLFYRLVVAVEHIAYDT